MEVRVPGWLHCSLGLCFSLLQCSVYLILAAGALTQQRLAALVNVNSTIWKTAGQEHRVSVVLDTEYAVHRGNSGGFWIECGRKQWNIKPSLKFQKTIQELLKAVFKVNGCDSNKALRWCWNKRLEAELFQLPLSTITNVCFQTSYSHHKVNESLLAPWNWCSSNSVVSVRLHEQDTEPHSRQVRNSFFLSSTFLFLSTFLPVWKPQLLLSGLDGIPDSISAD